MPVFHFDVSVSKYMDDLSTCLYNITYWNVTIIIVVASYVHVLCLHMYEYRPWVHSYFATYLEMWKKSEPVQGTIEVVLKDAKIVQQSIHIHLKTDAHDKLLWQFLKDACLRE